MEYRAKKLLKIISQMYESTIPPIRFGRKNAVRNRFVPRIPLVSASAMANATILMISIVTMVNREVYQRE